MVFRLTSPTSTSQQNTPPSLRLVRDKQAPPEAPRREPDAPARPELSPARQARLDRERVAYENACAAMLPPEDARWLFAVRVSGSLEGGKAALLTPTKRRDLIAAAVSTGLREFDANLIIAIVQDAARRGELGDRAGRVAGVASSLSLVGAAERNEARARRARTVKAIIATILATVLFFVLMVRWLLTA